MFLRCVHQIQTEFYVMFLVYDVQKDVFYVGDSEVDFALALRARVRCAIVTWGYRRLDEMKGIDSRIFVERADELERRIKRMNPEKVNVQEILTHCDHTMLRTIATTQDIYDLCDDAIKYNTASVCIPPSYVKKAKAYVQDRMKVCTVIGFPNGYSTTRTKVFEAKDECLSLTRNYRSNVVLKKWFNAVMNDVLNNPLTPHPDIPITLVTDQERERDVLENNVNVNFINADMTS